MDFLRAYQVSIPRGVTFGLGTSERVGEIAQRYGAKRTLIVTDRLLLRQESLKKSLKLCPKQGLTL